MKHFDEKWLLRGKLQNLGFLGFFLKNLKVKNVYLGGFSVKIEKYEWSLSSLSPQNTYFQLLGFFKKNLDFEVYP